MNADDTLLLAHGGGGQLTAELIERVILPALGDAGGQEPARLADSAVLDPAAWRGGAPTRLAFTTDTYVVQPLEFPGGDIGTLAVCGTINDLAVSGATPRAFSMGLVLEEGLEIALLRRVLESAGQTAGRAGVRIVTGDTKVVERGALSGIMINTAAVGDVSPQADLGFDRIGKGDAIVLSGPLGEHGLAVMCQRKGLGLAGGLASDCAAIHRLTEDLLDALGSDVHFMRDPTRGGLAATLVETAAAARRDLQIRQQALPVNPAALAAAEMLGLDLLTIANEGKLVAVVAAAAADRAVAALARHDIASRAAVIGHAGAVGDVPIVEMVTPAGGRRVVQMPYGEDLPRIC